MAKSQHHTVVKGDSVAAIARKYGSTIALIATANQMDNPALIRVGDVLCVPVPTSATPPVEPPVVPPKPPATGKSVKDFGASGNGASDDQAAIQRALDSLRPNETLLFPPGVYKHSDVLTVRTADVLISGLGATLHASNEARSSFHIDGDRVTVEGLTFNATTTRRWDAYEQHRVRFTGNVGVTLTNVQVLGSAASGIFIDGGASNFLLQDVLVRNTRADGIHMTGNAHDGRVLRARVDKAGDDGIAVVSYGSQNCKNIKIDSPRVVGGSHGRGLSVVGGENIVYTDVFVETSDAAGLYLACESSYSTAGVKNVSVTSGTFLRCNTDSAIDHGAILVYSSRSGKSVSDITLANLEVKETRTSASASVRIIHEGGGTVSNVLLRNVAVTGGPRYPFSSTASGVYSITGSTHNGTPFSK